MTESQNQEQDQTEQVDQVNTEQGAEVTEPKQTKRQKDQARIATWFDAVKQAPTSQDMEKAKADLDEAEALHKSATEVFQITAASRALVHGWQQVAGEAATTPKMLHSWAREHVPGEPDLSTIPGNELAREERRLKAEREESDREQARREKILAQMDAIKTVKKGKNR